MSKKANATVADRLDALCAKYDGTFERSTADGTVTILFTLKAGDRLSGTGATTESAVAALEAKLEKIGNAL